MIDVRSGEGVYSIIVGTKVIQKRCEYVSVINRLDEVTMIRDLDTS